MYALYSRSIDRIYVGQTQDLDKRLLEHREGASFYTKRATDWELFHTEEYESRAEAMIRERQLKSFRGRESLRKELAGGS